MTTKIYGPWIKWHGGECPVPPETIVEVKFRDGDSQSGHPAYAYYWHHDGDGADILTYCIITEQPDLEAAEQLLRANGYTVTPPAKSLTKHHIDHCHTTGKVRGLLCHRCNTRLGGLDDKQWRDAAFRYLGLQA